MKLLSLILLIVTIFIPLRIAYSADIRLINISHPDYADAKKIKEMIHFFNDLLKKTMPEELRHIRVIELDDIKDARNKKYYEEQVFFSFVQGDFNSNGFEDVALACIDDHDRYVVIFEKRKGKYILVKYFDFGSGTDIFVQFISKKNAPDWPDQNRLSVGFQGDSDDAADIKWINNEYQSIYWEFED